MTLERHFELTSVTVERIDICIDIISLHQFDMIPRVHSFGCFTSAKPVVVRRDPVSGNSLPKSDWLAFFEMHRLGYAMLQPLQDKI